MMSLVVSFWMTLKTGPSLKFDLVHADFFLSFLIKKKKNEKKNPQKTEYVFSPESVQLLNNNKKYILLRVVTP